MTTALWRAELLLEIIGAFLAFRAGIRQATQYIGFMAISDAALMVSLSHISAQAYSAAYFLQQAIAYFLLARVMILLCCKAVGDDEQTRKFYSLGIPIVAALLGIWFFSAKSMTLENLVKFGMGIDALICALVILCFANNEPAHPWKGLGIGAAWLSACNVIIGLAYSHGYRAAVSYKWVGEIGLLLMWAWACAKVSCGTVEGHGNQLNGSSRLQVFWGDSLTRQNTREGSGGAGSNPASPAKNEASMQRLPLSASEYPISPAGIEASSEVEGLALFSNHDFELLRKWRIRA